MLPIFKIRVPLGEVAGKVVTSVHQAAYLGSTYLFFSLAAIVLRYVYETQLGGPSKPGFGLGG